MELVNGLGYVALTVPDLEASVNFQASDISGSLREGRRRPSSREAASIIGCGSMREMPRGSLALRSNSLEGPQSTK